MVHCNHDGQSAEYDFSALPVDGAMQHSLAVLFAKRCHPDVWASLETSHHVFGTLRVFAKMLAQLPQPPCDLGELSAQVIERWWEQVRSKPSGREAFRNVCLLLRDDARLQSGPVHEALSRRVAAVKSKVQSFPKQKHDRVRAAARATVRRALLRIEENAGRLEKWRAGGYADTPNEGRDAVIGEFLDYLARTGEPPYRTGPSGVVNLPKKYRKAFGGQAAEQTWQRLFPTSGEVAALGVLLSLQFGWNQSTLNRMPTPRRSPDPGAEGAVLYRVEVSKRRRGRGYWYDTENIADGGAGTPGRLITDALALTRFARLLVEQSSPDSDRLLVWRSGRLVEKYTGVAQEWHSPVGRFHFGARTDAARKWARAQGLEVDSLFRRARRTATVTGNRSANGHSQQTQDRIYLLPDRQVQEESREVFVAGATDALGRARAVVLEAELHDHRDPADVETATADCKDFDRGPFPGPGGACAANFLLCLGCGNARVHADHHPRLVYLHQALSNLRSTEYPVVWESSWGDAHARLEHLRREVGEGRWSQAERQVSDRDRAVIHRLLNGDLNT